VLEAKGALEVVYPSSSIKAEPHLAWVDANVDRKGTRAVAEAYLQFVYTEPAQEIIAKHFYRPINPDVLKKHHGVFSGHQVVPRDVVRPRLGRGAPEVLCDNGVFDKIYTPRGK